MRRYDGFTPIRINALNPTPDSGTVSVKDCKRSATFYRAKAALREHRQPASLGVIKVDAECGVQVHVADRPQNHRR
ncbi:MAG: hypothetical protein ACRDTT_20670, partial [Pseudonocardiaceae bacterium]